MTFWQWWRTKNSEMVWNRFWHHYTTPLSPIRTNFPCSLCTGAELHEIRNVFLECLPFLLDTDHSLFNNKNFNVSDEGKDVLNMCSRVLLEANAIMLSTLERFHSTGSALDCATNKKKGQEIWRHCTIRISMGMVCVSQDFSFQGIGKWLGNGKSMHVLCTTDIA